MKVPDYTRPRYRNGDYGYKEFAGWAVTPATGGLTYKPSTGPDPELKLYTEVTGRRVTASFTHAAWRTEYAVTGQSIAMERMLALVTETTHCDALDGPEPAPAPVRRTWTARDGVALVFLVAVAVLAVLMVVL